MDNTKGYTGEPVRYDPEARAFVGYKPAQAGCLGCDAQQDSRPPQVAQQPATFNFEIALRLMRSGGAVRRSSWDGKIMYMLPAQSCIFGGVVFEHPARLFLGEQGLMDTGSGRHRRAVPDEDEVVANDWQEVVFG